ncbi:TetR/AcrR family transcriptional regulator [Aeromicrobium sp. 179-A 4D2 NHS]|uniref:TetR/AcrR family transcriptional regulator n=1 Tax=Aeromicrobium sp. 179-A 4D2 NHS TaxID=3142375 RepID=UPI0039A27C0B
MSTVQALDATTLTPGARRILTAASDLFYRHGIHAVGVDAIADASGVTKRTLYDRFGSKDVLVATYLRARHEQWWERLEQRLASSPAPRALALFDAYAHDAPSIDRGCAFLNAAGELPAEHPGQAVIRVHKRAVRERLEQLVREDRPGLDAPDTADHLFLLLEGGVAHHGIDGGRLLGAARGIAARLLG